MSNKEQKPYFESPYSFFGVLYLFVFQIIAYAANKELGNYDHYHVAMVSIVAIHAMCLALGAFAAIFTAEMYLRAGGNDDKIQ
jgi:hypothetical protein